MGNFIDGVINKKLSRRNFIAASAASMAALALPGCGNKLVQVSNPILDVNEGKWVSAACWHNCGGGCVNKVLIKDGVVLRQKTDDTHQDSPEFPQQRACLRGRSLQQEVFGVDRIKYPMKRKQWEPGGGDKSLRGRDEWERISWDEALDYVAAELKKAKENYGPNSILSLVEDYFNTTNVLYEYGGATSVWDTASPGSYALPWDKVGMTPYGLSTANDRFDLKNADTIILVGTNPAWTAGSLSAYSFLQARKAGAEFIYVGPSYNATAAVFDARWIPVHAGTDTAFLLAVAYTLITEDDPVTNPLIDWDCLSRCALGFDADHMPEGAKLNENFKDYVLGKYDDTPKTPAWASKICGTPVEDIVFYARKIRKDNKVTMLHSFAPARCSGGEDFPHIFATIGFMTGHLGKPGHACGLAFKGYFNQGSPLVTIGETGLPEVENPVDDCINAPYLANAILDGKYLYTGSLQWLPGKWRDIDIRVIVNEDKAGLQGFPSLTLGIEAWRKVDFIVTQAYNFNTQAKYSDIILPVTTHWERPGTIWEWDKEAILAFVQVVEPLYEARSDQWVAIELAKRLGVGHEKIFPFDEKQQFFNQIAGCTVISEDGQSYGPLVTITAEDIAKWGVMGEPQTGKIGLQEFLDQGIYRVERHEGDNFGYYGCYEDFIKDPDNNPMGSPSGKFEIYSEWKADLLNNTGIYDMKFKPYPSYTVPPVGYQATFSDWGKQIKGEYPYVVSNPHYLRRTHGNMDNLPWLREACVSPVFLNRQDAEEKGIKTGDTVLIWNAYGKILRQASVSETTMPGMVELPHGAWVDMDENTGIDKAGTDNILCGPVSSNLGVSGYNNYICNFKKYDGRPLVPDYLKPQQVPKVG